jgi:hypothetical protein
MDKIKVSSTGETILPGENRSTWIKISPITIHSTKIPVWTGLGSKGAPRQEAGEKPPEQWRGREEKHRCKMANLEIPLFPNYSPLVNASYYQPPLLLKTQCD